MKLIYPPFGYKFKDGGGVDIEDEQGVLGIIRGLSEELYEIGKTKTQKERLTLLTENGFEINEE